jgi:hypothetical protein
MLRTVISDGPIIRSRQSEMEVTFPFLGGKRSSGGIEPSVCVGCPEANRIASAVYFSQLKKSCIFLTLLFHFDKFNSVYDIFILFYYIKSLLLDFYPSLRTS